MASSSRPSFTLGGDDEEPGAHPSTASLTLLRGRLLGECLIASRQVEGLRAQVASDIKATLSEAATPLAVAGLPCGGYPITRFYVIGGARFRRLLLDAEQSPPHANPLRRRT